MKQIRRGSGTVPPEINPSASESRKSMHMTDEAAQQLVDQLPGTPVVVRSGGDKFVIGEVISAYTNENGVFYMMDVQGTRITGQAR